MKSKSIKSMIITVLLTMLFLIAGIGMISASAQTGDVVVFGDANLKETILRQLNKDSSYDITKADMAGLVNLDTPQNDPQKQIKSLTGLEHAVNLESLNLDYNKIVDLTPIANLTKLANLSVAYNTDLTDISKLSGLDLVEFKAHGNGKINDFSVVANFENLTFLNLSICNISDISFVENLTKLTSLYLSFNGEIEDISKLANLTDLTVLSLDNNKIKDISVLSGLTKLVRLSAENNYISDFEPIYELVNMEALNISRNFLPDSQATKLNEVFEELNPTLYPLKNGFLSNITLSVDKSEFKVGETATISFEISPVGNEIFYKSFKSADTAIATVNSDGVVTGVKAGETKIIAHVNNIIKEVNVKVNLKNENDDKPSPKKDKGCGSIITNSSGSGMIGAVIIICLGLIAITLSTRQRGHKKQ